MSVKLIEAPPLTGNSSFDSWAYKLWNIVNLFGQEHNAAGVHTAASLAAAGTFAVPAETGNYSVTGLSFTPKVVQFMIAIPANIEYAVAGMGWMTSSAQGAIATWVLETGPAAATSHASDHCILIVNASAVDDVAAQYVSMNTDGFTINFTVRAASRNVYWLALG